jgi:NAD(P)-dependent dehydrogenase (short-subunit alcohol dehydrogenase family)
MERKVALVTGASRGIGAATAVALAEKGYNVTVAARTLAEGERHEHSPFASASDTSPLPGSLEATAAEVRKRGCAGLPLRMDLLDRASLHAAVDETEAQLGPIDLLVNNGIYQANVISQLILIQRVVPGMLERGGGAIINVVSASATLDPPAPSGEGGWGFGYVSAKAALIRLAGILAVEYKDAGVGFFNVEPGFVLTESMKQGSLGAKFREQWGGAPPEVPAAVMAWLATDPAAADWQGKMVDTQRLCKKLGLVPGWPKAR